MTSDPPLLSVCIHSGRSDKLTECLASLRAQVSPPPFEILVSSKGASDGVLDLARARFPEILVSDTGGRLPGDARNPLVERARGSILLFLDDDVTVPPRLLSTLAATAAQHPDVAVFGGPNETPPGSTPFQVVQGAVLSSLVGAGPVSRRYGPRAGGLVDERWFTLCNLAVRRSAMVPFLPDLACAEENALLSELRSNGHAMLYEPALRAFHDRRTTLRGFAAQILKYGRGRGQLLRKRPSTVRLAHLTPSALLTYLLLLPALVALGGNVRALMGPVVLYTALVLVSGSRIGWTLKRPGAVAPAAVLTIIVHVCYGLGVARGLIGRGPELPDHVSARWLAAASQPESAPAGASPVDS